MFDLKSNVMVYELITYFLIVFLVSVEKMELKLLTTF